MSYDIYIGNAELRVNDVNDCDGEYSAEFTVHGMALPDAPSFPFDSMTGNSNSRHPGYSQWSNFTTLVGLYDLFFGKHEGLMRRHPGCFRITHAHLSTVTNARAAWQQLHPNAVPGWNYDDMWNNGDGDDGVRGRDSALARLLWLEWWMRWSIENCERPAIYNR